MPKAEHTLGTGYSCKNRLCLQEIIICLSGQTRKWAVILSEDRNMHCMLGSMEEA